MRDVIIATNNSNKVREIREILDLDGFKFLSLKDAAITSNPIEDADTFAGNALIKARAAHEASGGMAALADDSGLCVDALGGEPGVYSARYAGPDADDAANNALLFERLDGVVSDARSARFVCAIAFVSEDGEEYVAEGTVEGAIGFEERGENGFGYDPMFYPAGFGGLSFAEIKSEEKNAVSHRFRALEKVRPVLLCGRDS